MGISISENRTLETGVDPLPYYTFVSMEETTCIHLRFQYDHCERLWLVIIIYGFGCKAVNKSQQPSRTRNYAKFTGMECIYQRIKLHPIPKTMKTVGNHATAFEGNSAETTAHQH